MLLRQYCGANLEGSLKIPLLVVFISYAEGLLYLGRPIFLLLIREV